MDSILLAMPGADACATGLQRLLQCELGMVDIHRFPDGESCPRLPLEVVGRDVVLVGRLDWPDPKIMALYLTACIARELGARSVGLLLPYLPYMRQDARFEPGQGITSQHFAGLLSACCDWLVTVDPHLHRHRSLAAIYRVPTLVVQAAPAIAAWIAAHVARPIVVGPDGESEQWAARVAALAACPVTVLRKTRSGDREVAVSIVMGADLADRTPVLVDDIVATAGTMVAATRQLRAAGMPPPVCIAVHALFAGQAAAMLAAAGAGRIVSCNTVAHASNQIDVTPDLARAVRRMLDQPAV